MSLQDDRIAALEREVTSIKVQLAAEQNRWNKIQEDVTQEQTYAVKDLYHRTGILLGLATKQQEITKEVQADIKTMKRDINNLKGDIADIEIHLDRQDQRLDRMEKRFDQVDSRLDQHDQRFDRIDSRLDQHDQRFDRLEAILTQILARLPEKP